MYPQQLAKMLVWGCFIVSGLFHCFSDLIYVIFLESLCQVGSKSSLRMKQTAWITTIISIYKREYYSKTDKTKTGAHQLEPLRRDLNLEFGCNPPMPPERVLISFLISCFYFPTSNCSSTTNRITIKVLFEFALQLFFPPPHHSSCANRLAMWAKDRFKIAFGVRLSWHFRRVSMTIALPNSPTPS